MEKIYNKPELMQSASSNIKTKLNLKVDIVEIQFLCKIPNNSQANALLIGLSWKHNNEND